MSFLRHWEIYRVSTLLRERQTGRRSRAHPLDEFPVGYSSRVALHHCPLPLRHRRALSEELSIRARTFFCCEQLSLSGLAHDRGSKCRFRSSAVVVSLLALI